MKKSIGDFRRKKKIKTETRDFLHLQNKEDSLVINSIYWQVRIFDVIQLRKYKNK